MAKKKVGWPWEEQKIWVTNRLSNNKAVHVMIMPNTDYAFAELLVSFIGIGSSALGMVKTANDLVRLIRVLSLIRNTKDIMDKLREVIPRSSVTIHPGGQVEVYNAWFNAGERFSKPVTSVFEMFGGKTRTIIITDEDFKNTVKFDTEVNKNYIVNETGVEPPMHYWNGGHVISGLLSSATPSLVRMENDMLMVYRHNKGERIFLAELKDGYWNNKGRGWINVDSKQGIAATTLQGNLALIARDHKGDQMFSLWQYFSAIPFDDHEKFMGPDIQGKPSVTTMGDTIYAVARHYPGNAVMWSSRDASGHIEWGNTMLTTGLPPSIQAFKGKLYVFYIRPNVHKISMAVSTDNGHNWTEVSTEVGYTSAGVALTIYKDRMYMFYRDPTGNGVFYKWTEDGSTFKEPPNRYFAFDVVHEPTAAPMPGGDNGIMVAGILTAEWRVQDFLDVPDDEAIIWTILKPWEPKPKLIGRGKAVKKKPAKAAKKAVKSKGRK